MPESNNEISMQSEVTRKLLHLSSIWIPLFFYYVPRSTVLWILIPFTLFSLTIDYGRFYVPAINHFVQKLFGGIMRTHEQDAGRKLLSGATYVFVSATLCILIFPRNIAVTAFAVLIVCDAASALIGRRYGRHKVLDKSWEGTLAFVIFGWMVVLICPRIVGHWQEYAIAFLATVVGALVEMASTKLRLDDNLSVPTAIGFTLWGGYWVLSKLNPAVFADVLQLLSAGQS